MPAFKDITNKTFARLTVVSLAEKRSGKKLLWKCFCSCGNTCYVSGSNLTTGTTRSCGCLRKEKHAEAVITHGKTNTPEYRVWRAMKSRCYLKTNQHYARYGGRGIKICSQWINSFETFLSDLGTKPSSEHSIDRVNNNLGYSPENCRWATKKEQANNCHNTLFLSHGGLTLPLHAWAEKLGVKPDTLHKRHRRGWSDEKILSCPIRPRTTASKHDFQA